MGLVKSPALHPGLSRRSPWETREAYTWNCGLRPVAAIPVPSSRSLTVKWFSWITSVEIDPEKSL